MSGTRISLRRIPHLLKLANNVGKRSRYLGNVKHTKSPIIIGCNYKQVRCFSTKLSVQCQDVEKREFQAETKMLLDIVARSLYSEREVFIRELISNASDALEKFRYKILSGEIKEGDRKLEIKIITDKTNRCLIIQDSGIGMTKNDLISNLGTIAKSGSKAFLEELKQKGAKSDPSSNIIGQFGVGFYSAFMVSDKVEVYTRALGGEGLLWTSDGTGTYEIKTEKDVDYGTKIVLHLKSNCREYSEEYAVKKVVEKYSNFVGSPILLNGVRANTIEPLWMKTPKEISETQHAEFYRYIGNSFDNPRYVIHYATEVPLSIKALLYVSETKPPIFEMSRDTDPGVSLYTRKILIKNKARSVLPVYLRFLKGVVDCEDIPLNLSRELLQNSRLIANLRKTLTTKVLRFLQDQMNKDVEKYNKFYLGFNPFLKEGVVTTDDQKEREDIAALLRYESSKTDSGVTVSLNDYIKSMKEGQKDIFYMAAPSRELATTSPYYESLKAKDVNVLFCYDPYDELVLMQLRSYRDKGIKSVEAELRNDKTATNIAELGENCLRRSQIEELSKWLKTTLDGRVHDIRAVGNLDSHPCVITVEEMAAARHFLRTSGLHLPLSDQYAILKPQLDINPKNLLIRKLHELMTKNPKIAELLANQLFLNSMVSAGLVQNPQVVVQSINELLEKTLEKL